MAVSNEQAPNLASSYSLIQDALNKRANLESQRPQITDIATAGVTRLDKELIARREFEKKMATEGKILVTKDKVKELTDTINNGLSPESQLSPDTLKYSVGLYKTPEELQSDLEQHIFNKSISSSKDLNDLQKSSARFSPKETAKQIAEKAFTEKGTVDSYEKALADKYNKGEITLDQFASMVEKYKSSSSSTKTFRSKDEYGRDTITYEDGRTRVLNGGEAVPQGELVTKKVQLHPAEQKTFNENLNTFDSKTIKESKKTFDELDKLEKSVDQNNPVSFFNNKIGLVRIGGIAAGRMAQGEIVQEAGARDIVSQYQQKIQTLRSGDWTPANKKLIKEYITSLKAIEKEHINNELDSTVEKTLSSMPNSARIDPEFIKKEFSKPLAPYLKEKQGSSDQEATDYLIKNKKVVNPETIKRVKEFLSGQK